MPVTVWWAWPSRTLPIPQRDAIQAVLDRETDPKAKSFRPEEFMDASFFQQIEGSAFRGSLYNN
jgi:hypothetical protein